MNWISIDPAKGISGVAYWNDTTLDHTKVVKARGNKGAFYVGAAVVPSRSDAWNHVLDGQESAIMEKGAGGRANIVSAQGWICGYIQKTADQMHVDTHIVNVSEWRRCIKEGYDVSWPQNRERKKALAVQLVKRIYGLDVTDDEADAVLLGLAAIRMGIVAL